MEIDTNKLELLRAMLSGDYDPKGEHDLQNNPISTDLHRYEKEGKEVSPFTFEEQLAQFEALIDKALLNNKSFIDINHGKGQGILRKALHKRLRKMSVVKKYESLSENTGITRVYLK